MDSMKKFKNAFAVKADTLTMINAFKEFAISVGWKEQSGYIYNGIWFQGGDNNKGNIEYGHFAQGHVGDGIDPTDATVYTLPAQWQAAMDAASEVEEVRFKVGKKYKGHNGKIVLCTIEGNENFGGITVVADSITAFGYYSENFCGDSFTEYNQPVTL